MNWRFLLSPSLLLLLALATSPGCQSDEPTPLGDGGLGAGEGEACRRTGDCAPKLVCAGTATCQRAGEPGTSELDENCGATNDCVFGLVCSADNKCSEPGTSTAGQRCAGNEQCAAGLVCSGEGKCAEPGAPGTKDKGQDCEGLAECSLGLVCLEGKCTPFVPWTGATCTADTGPFRAYFEIPRGGEPLSEFYRLPFPNDIRIKNGRVDVTGHPNPGLALPPAYAAVPGEYLKRLNADVGGWGVNTTVLLRLSGRVDLGTINVSGDNVTVEWLDIDEASPNYARNVGLGMFASQSRGKYICDNYITVRPNIGDPLRASTVYAVLLRRGIKNADGDLAVQDDDFKTVIGETEPTSADEKAAWNSYAPLRAYFAAKQIDPKTVISAAVFTTINPRHRMAHFRDAVRAEGAPSPTKLTLCDGKAKSPCDDGKTTTHVCPVQPDAAFDELQFVYNTPVFQKGTPPYLEIGDGGDVVYDKDGAPQVQREDQVCAALTLPKGEMPAEGWPVVIYAHGTGGGYRSFIGDGTAAGLADVRDASGSISRMAVISIDAGMHGPRRGSDVKPDELFFNLRNPVAARDNTYQAVADKFQLMRVVESFALDGAASPTGQPIKLDPNRIYFFGHSQGTIEGTPFVAYEPGIKAVLLSGAGGYLIGAMLNKTKPLNIAASVQFVLADGRVGTNHPLLNLLQLYFEEIDTLNYGRQVFREPPEGLTAKHTFFSYGVADGYTPPMTADALALTMGLPRLDQSAERCGDGVCSGSEDCNSCSKDCPDKNACGPFPSQLKLVAPPVKENRSTPTGSVTAALVPYSGDGSYDDHFSVFRNPHGQQQSRHFFGTAARDGAPTIPK